MHVTVKTIIILLLKMKMNKIRLFVNPNSHKDKILIGFVFFCGGVSQIIYICNIYKKPPIFLPCLPTYNVSFRNIKSLIIR